MAVKTPARKTWSVKASADRVRWFGFPNGDKPASSLSVLGHNLLADNEGAGVNSRTLVVTGVSSAGVLVLNWVARRTAIFAGPPVANNGNTFALEHSQDYGPGFPTYSLSAYSIASAAGGSDHQATVTKSSGDTEELTVASIIISGGSIGTRKSIVNRTAAGAGATLTSGVVTMTDAGLLVAVGSGSGDVNATAPTQTWPVGWTVHRSVARSSAEAALGHVPLYVATKPVAAAGDYSVGVQVTINEGIVLGLYGVQP